MMAIEAKDEPGLRSIYEGWLADSIYVLIFFGLFSITITLWKLSSDELTQHDKMLLLGAWGILPPIWFLVEYFFIYLPYGVKGSFNYFQYGQSVAAKVWAAVLALISVSIYNKGK